MEEKEGVEATGQYAMIDKMKKWHNFFIQHRYIPIADLELQDSLMQSPVCFKFILKNIHNILYVPQVPKDKLLHLRIKLFMTFYSKKLGKFFGRTCESLALDLVEDANSGAYYLQKDNPFCLYYHSKLTKESQALLIIETHIYEIGENNVVFGSKALGYVDIPALQVTIQKDKQMQMKKGSPRDLMTHIQGQQQMISAQIIFNLEDYNYLRQVHFLIPDSVLVSSYDTVPGVIEDRLPCTINQQELILKQSVTIYITQIKIKVPQQVEIDIKKQILNFLSVTGNSQTTVKISQCELAAAYHNGWICVNGNGRGLSNKIQLRQQLSSNQTYLMYDYAGKMEIDNIFDGELCVIILQLNYELEITTNIGKQTISKSVGWIPIHIGSQFGQEHFIVNDVFFKGPGKTVDGRKMFHISLKEEYNIKINCEINLREASKISSRQHNAEEEEQGPTRVEGVKSQVFMQSRKKYDDAEDLQINLAIQNMQQEVQDLKEKNEIYEQQLQQFGITSQQLLQQKKQEKQKGDRDAKLYSTDPMHIIYQQNMSQFSLEQLVRDLQERELALLQMLQEVKDEKEGLKTKQEKEFESLKKTLNQQNSKNNTQDNYIPILTESISPAKRGILDQEQTLEQIFKTQKAPNLSFDIRHYMIHPDVASNKISHLDKLNLARYGVKGILEIFLQEDVLNLSSSKIDQELIDPYKVNEITFDFVGLYPIFIDIQTQDPDKTRRLLQDPRCQGEFIIPYRFFFIYKFYDFPQEKSPVLVLKDIKADQVIQKVLAAKDIILLEKEITSGEEQDQNIEKMKKKKNIPSKTFLVDPSKDSHKNLHRNFIEYLASKTMQIDIYDADNQFHFGVCRIQLNKLLRNSKQKIKLPLKVAILEPSLSRIKGELVLQLSNNGSPPTQTDQTDQQDVIIDSIHENQFYRKVISNEPMIIPEDYINKFQDKTKTKINIGEIQDESLRKQERIKRFKINQMQNAIQDHTKQQTSGKGKDSNNDKEVNNRIVQEISHFKELRKNQYINGILDEMIPQHNKVKIHPSFGQAHVFQYTIQNQNKEGKQIFQVIINDPDAYLFQNSQREIYLINDPDEWEYWVKKEHFIPPPNYDLINKIERPKEQKILSVADQSKITIGQEDQDEFSDQYTFLIDENQKITVLFCFISYRRWDESLQEQQDAYDIYNKSELNFKLQNMLKRNINIKITEKGGQLQKSSFILQVEPRRIIIDQSFKYFEKENSLTQIVLPKLFNSQEAPEDVQSFHIQCNVNDVLLKFINNDNILIELQSPQQNQHKTFYGESYLLLGDRTYQHIIVFYLYFDYYRLDLSVKMGQISYFKLKIPAGPVSTFAQIYSTIPSTLQSFEQKIALTQNKETTFVCKVESMYEEDKIAQLNCINIISKQLIHSWLINIITIPPSVTQKFTLYKAKKYAFSLKGSKVADVSDRIQSIPFQNKTNKLQEFFYKSSNSFLLYPINTSSLIKPQETSDISLLIEDISQEGEYKCYLFIKDKEGLSFECIEIRVICQDQPLDKQQK